LKFISEFSPHLPDALQALLLTGKRDDAYRLVFVFSPRMCKPQLTSLSPN
jgi:hypothetical protein